MEINSKLRPDGENMGPEDLGLEVRDLTVKYGSLTAVNQVSFTVAPGHMLALLGPSGCGKSSLLRAIAGLEPAVSGTVSFGGEDLSRTPTHRRGFGMMFQDGQLFPSRTVAGNIAYGLHGLGWSKQQQQERVAELIDLVGLSSMADRDIATLSGGQAQRAALARSLAPNPRCLLFDEPLSALDRGLRERMVSVIGEIMQTTGTTGVYVTHDQDEAFALADQIAMMNQGKIVQLASPAQLWLQPADRTVAEFLGYGPFLDRTEITQLEAAKPLQELLDRNGGRWIALEPAAVELADPHFRSQAAGLADSATQPAGTEPAGKPAATIEVMVTAAKAGRGVWDVDAKMLAHQVSFTAPMSQPKPQPGQLLKVQIREDRIVAIK
ncbi:ABC transporter ATP-binding protein [Boudabousia marimammalium]|uniref:ABC-type quaternary amine transporter n=1 Tax=Boudabousia marimammalium TaxID=156892 RepID=A0A1Q5PM23_9ACTO|nr:ABC transporter ATP-binding protein [Boudabousia marimammalium]OKL48103.1 hypothetical protein BM477_06490 [Boudabousia marimammalium]